MTSFEEIHHRLSVEPDAAGFGRRSFLLGALAAGGVSALGLGRFATAAAAAEPLEPIGPTDTILVLIQLGGGNDGLNTVVPVGDPAYAQLRSPGVRVSRPYDIGGGFGFHPALRMLTLAYALGGVGVVHGVGDPDGDRNHFSSMASWMAGTHSADRSTGWIGRFLDGLPDGDNGFRGVTTDGRVPLHLVGARSQVSALGGSPFGAERTMGARVALFDALAGYGAATGSGAVADQISMLNRDAIDRARTFGGGALTNSIGVVAQLTNAARVINLNVGARVLSVTHGSFDTHRSQYDAHHRLLAQLDAGIEAFYATLDPSWTGQVVLATFSEFGRRAHDNGSGTDHGSAAPQLVIGERVRGGHYGTPPSLTDLAPGGDLRVTTDFRAYYASLLSGWLGADPAPILGGSHAVLPFIDSLPTGPPPKPSPPAETRFEPFRDAGVFVDQQYHDFLGTDPTAANRAAWIDRLRSRTTEIHMALEEFFLASPYFTRGLLAHRLTWNLTGAPASGDDVRRWLRNSTPLRTMVEEIVASAPWRARYSRITRSALVRELHFDLTGAEPHPFYSAVWSERVGASPEPGSIDLIVDLALTGPARAHHHAEAEIASLYTAMHREAPPVEHLTVWGRDRRAGMPIPLYAAVFFLSAPYRARFT